MAPTKLHGITFYNVLSMQGFQRTMCDRLSDPTKIQKVRMVGQAGLEPATPRLSSACSNQLSYRPVFRDRSSVAGWWRQGDSNS